MTNSNNWASALQLALQAGWTDEDIAARLHELVSVLDSLSETYAENSFYGYMTDRSSFLQGASPIDAILLGNYEEVLEILAQEKIGAAA